MKMMNRKGAMWIRWGNTRKTKKKQQHNLKVEYGIVTRDQNKTNAPNFANLLLDSNSSIVIIIVFVVVNSFPSLAQLKCGPLFLSHHQKLLKLLHSMLYNTVKHAHRRDSYTCREFGRLFSIRNRMRNEYSSCSIYARVQTNRTPESCDGYVCVFVARLNELLSERIHINRVHFLHADSGSHSFGYRVSTILTQVFRF